MPPEDNVLTGDQSNDQQGDGDNNLPTTIEGWQKYGEALNKRLRDEREKIKNLNSVNSSLDERIKAIEKANREKLEKDGDFRSLAEKHAADVEKYKPLAERAGELEAIIRESNEARIKNIPDQMKNLIPMDYPPEKLQKWLNANDAQLVKPPAADYDAGAGAGNRGGGSQLPKLTDDERTAARMAGMSEKTYAELKQQRGQPIELVKKPATP